MQIDDGIIIDTMFILIVEILRCLIASVKREKKRIFIT